MAQRGGAQVEGRITGYDVARAAAVAGMFVVNFSAAMCTGREAPPWLAWLVEAIYGKAAASFVVLAGIGLALLSRRARVTGDFRRLTRNRNTLFRRAMFLFVLGLAHTVLWPADILHFYGLYLAAGALLLAAPGALLLGLAAGCVALFTGLAAVFDWYTGWNWALTAYEDFWTPAGMSRHLAFNGFHPVFPWLAFLPSSWSAWFSPRSGAATSPTAAPRNRGAPGAGVADAAGRDRAAAEPDRGALTVAGGQRWRMTGPIGKQHPSSIVTNPPA